MSRQYVDVILTSLNSPLLGQIRLNDAAKLSTKQEATRTAVKTMNRQRTARGYRSGTKTYSGQLTMEVQMPPEVDWALLFLADDEFLLTYEMGDGGQRFQLVDCIISNVDTEGDEDGGTQMTIDF